MKKKIFILLALAAVMFTSCLPDADTLILKTPEEICEFMTQKYPGTFTVKEFKRENEDSRDKSITVTLISSETEKLITTKHYYRPTMFDVLAYFESDFYSQYFADEAAQIVKNDVETNMPERFEYKLYGSPSDTYYDCEEVTIANAEEFINKYASGSFTIVIKDELKEDPSENKEFYRFCQKIKAKYSIVFIVCLDPDADLEELTAEQVFSYEYKRKFEDHKSYFVLPAAYHY